jgi:two-component system chemotaxis response regulator CheB
MTAPAAGSAIPERGAPIRVLVVDDSPSQRALLVALLEADPAIDVVGSAANGAEGVRLAARLRPDLITMDLRMPVMDGLEATRRIMQETPTPVVMVTASASRENQKLVFESLQAGVLAILAKPALGPGGRTDGAELLRTVKSMARVRVIRRWAPERFRSTPAAPVTGGAPPALAPAPAALRPAAIRPEVVAIGASTGGPQALQQILTGLPATFPLPVLIVQHIVEGFISGLVDWLGSQCRLPVQLAGAGTPIQRSRVYIAPSGRHLVVQGRSLSLSDERLVSGHRPSATVLFQSVARAYRAAAIGVLLSGMGDDGAAGLRDLKRAGAVTLAQNESSSVVFGMPAVAIGMGVVDHVLPPAQIGPALVRLAGDAG